MADGSLAPGGALNSDLVSLEHSIPEEPQCIGLHRKDNNTTDCPAPRNEVAISIFLWRPATTSKSRENGST